MRSMLGLILVIGFFSATVTHAEETKQGESNTTKIESSEKKWLDLRKKSKGSYSYKKTFSSWVGFGSETTIVVRDNKVAERHYREWTAARPVLMAPGQKPKPEQPRERSWVEKGDQVGSHKEGAKPLTLDELYQAAKVVAGKTLSPHEKMYVRFDKHGLLNSCFYVDTRIMDDAPQTGVAIQDIKLKNLVLEPNKAIDTDKK